MNKVGLKKSMVLAVTPNPALDLGGVADRIKPNEKSYVHEVTRSAGGNAINVARVLNRLRVPVLATGFLGGGVGQEIKFLLDKEGVENNFVNIKDHSRISVTVSNRSDHRQTRLSFPGPVIRRNENAQFRKLLNAHSHAGPLVIGGSLLKGFDSADINQLLRRAQRHGIGAVIDCPAHVLREVVDEGALLIKPNLDEFQELVGKKVTTIASVQKAARKLLDRIDFVCVSSVEGGALLMSQESTYFGRIPKIKIRSTVGAGDSMVGAIVAKLFHGESSGSELLKWGLAASAASLSHMGTAMGTRDEILSLYKKVKVEMI